MNIDPDLSLDAHPALPGVDDPHDPHDAEAALEALRMAIGHQGSYADPGDGGAPPTLAESGHGDADAYAHAMGVGGGAGAQHTLSAEQWEGVERAAAALEGMQGTVEALAAGLEIQLGQEVRAGADGALQPDAALKKLVQTSKAMRDTVRGLLEQLEAGQIPAEPSWLHTDTVPRTEYDGIKYRLDAMLAQGEGKKGKRRQTKKETEGGRVGHMNGLAGPSGANGEDSSLIDPSLSGLHAGDDLNLKSREGSLMENGTEGTRRRRSMRLEHLIHSRANQLLGVKYKYKSSGELLKGSSTLPAPSSTPPGPAESVFGIQEHRPEWTLDHGGRGVRQFLDQVVDEVMLAREDTDVDLESVVEKVSVYWVRLCKRWEEQEARARGELHRDEVTRRKQNQFRRQQSLLARRQYAFETSPLNLCKLRALYRSLLTIDYAAPTNDQPDPSRLYSADEWYAYRKFVTGPGAREAHEVVDIPWLSDTARSLLNILDVYSADLTVRSKKKGKPKTPAPTFHLPSSLWTLVGSNLPVLRPKDADGLPVPDQPGLIIFRFAVSDEVQRAYPTWSVGLYDNPPMPEEDAALLGLGEVLNSSAYAYLRPRIQWEKEKASPEQLDDAGVQDMLARKWDERVKAWEGVPPAPNWGAPEHSPGSDLDSATAQATQDLLDAEAASASASAAALGSATHELFGATNPHFLSAQLGLGSGGSGHMTPQQLESLLASASASASGAGAGGGGSSGTGDTLAGLGGLGSLGVGGALGVSVGLGAGHKLGGPSSGSSLRARKVAKRSVGQSQPEGAAVPVKRRRLDDVAGGGGQGALEADMGALSGL